MSNPAPIAATEVLALARRILEQFHAVRTGGQVRQVARVSVATHIARERATQRPAADELASRGLELIRTLLEAFEGGVEPASGRTARLALTELVAHANTLAALEREVRP